MIPEIFKETVALITPDGIRLDADLYRPNTTEPLPILLMRQPYGRSISSTVVYAHPTWYAAQGYLVVVQDVRGRGSSQGEFKLFSHEAEDGLATVNWAAQLPGSNGSVGMYGFSYQGMTQLYAASGKPTGLKTIAPAMIGYDLYQDWAYEGGAFCFQANLTWAIQLAAETARLRGDAAAFQALFVASRQPPFYDPAPTQPEVLQRFAPDSFYFDWINHPDPTDPYWQALQPQMQQVDLPMLHIGGWFDTYLRGTLRFYRERVTHSAYPQHLWIGPWAHLPWGRKVGAIDYGMAAVSSIDLVQIQWFNYFLKGIGPDPRQQDSIHLFEMGSNQWFHSQTWPQTTPIYYCLSNNGLVGIRNSELRIPNSIDSLVHDPWRPVPSLGGHAGSPAGGFDRLSIDDRSDVLTYTTAPLTEAMRIVGELQVEIFCESEALSFDLCAVLSEVSATGVFNFSQGYLRVTPGQQRKVSGTGFPLTIVLQPTCIQIPSGHALRLSLSAACFPNTVRIKPRYSRLILYLGHILQQ